MGQSVGRAVGVRKEGTLAVKDTLPARCLVSFSASSLPLLLPSAFISFVFFSGMHYSFCSSPFPFALTSHSNPIPFVFLSLFLSLGFPIYFPCTLFSHPFLSCSHCPFFLSFPRLPCRLHLRSTHAATHFCLIPCIPFIFFSSLGFPLGFPCTPACHPLLSSLFLLLLLPFSLLLAFPSSFSSFRNTSVALS